MNSKGMDTGVALAIGWIFAGAGLALDLSRILDHVRAGGGKSGSSNLIPLILYGMSSWFLFKSGLGDLAALPLLLGGLIHVVQVKVTGPRWYTIQREPYLPTRDVMSCRPELFPALTVYDHVLRPAPDLATAQWIRKELAIDRQEPHFLLAEDGKWYRLVNIKSSKRVDLWSRFWFHPDLIVAHFDLEECENPPFSDTWLRRELLSRVKLYEIENGEKAAREVRRRLRSIKTQPELYAWLNALDHRRERYRVDPGKRKER